MMRVINVVERNTVSIPQAPVVVGAGQVKEIFPDTTKTEEEIYYLEIQNVGENDAYFALGFDCTAANYNGKIVPSQSYSFGVRQKVTVYSADGTTIARTKIVRNDNIQPPTYANQ